MAASAIGRGIAASAVAHVLAVIGVVAFSHGRPAVPATTTYRVTLVAAPSGTGGGGRGTPAPEVPRAPAKSVGTAPVRPAPAPHPVVPPVARPAATRPAAHAPPVTHAATPRVATVPHAPATPHAVAPVAAVAPKRAPVVAHVPPAHVPPAHVPPAHVAPTAAPAKPRIASHAKLRIEPNATRTETTRAASNTSRTRPPAASPHPTPRADNRAAEHASGGGPPTSKGRDVADVRVVGLEFPFPGYLDNLVRQVRVRFAPTQTRTPLHADLAFVVGRDGSISDLRVVRSSGSYAFDLEAQGAVEAAGSAHAFGPLPDGFRGSSLPVTFSFDPRSAP